MERLSAFELVTLLLVVTVNLVSPQQISTPCTSSMISTFTPCFNFVTGSSSNGTSPTSTCCEAFKSLMSTSRDCVCLIITANVPLPLTISVGMNLPQACNMNSVTSQCKATGTPLPTPGPVLLRPPAPAPAPASAVPGGSTAAPRSPAPTASSPSSPGTGATRSRPRHRAPSPLSPRGSKELLSSASLLQSETAPTLAPTGETNPAIMSPQDMAETAKIKPVLSQSSSVMSCFASSSSLIIIMAFFSFNLY